MHELDCSRVSWPPMLRQLLQLLLSLAAAVLATRPGLGTCIWHLILWPLIHSCPKRQVRKGYGRICDLQRLWVRASESGRNLVSLAHRIVPWSGSASRRLSLQVFMLPLRLWALRTNLSNCLLCSEPQFPRQSLRKIFRSSSGWWSALSRQSSHATWPAKQNPAFPEPGPLDYELE